MKRKITCLITLPLFLSSCFLDRGTRYIPYKQPLQKALAPQPNDYLTDINFNTIDNFFKNDFDAKNRHWEEKKFNGIINYFTKDAFSLEKSDGSKRLHFDYEQKSIDVRKVDGEWIKEDGTFDENVTIKYHVILKHLLPNDDVNNIKFTQSSYLLLSDERVYSLYETKTYDDYKLTGDPVLDGYIDYIPEITNEDIEISRLYYDYSKRATLIPTHDYKRRFSAISNEQYSSDYSSFINGISLTETKSFLENIVSTCVDDYLLLELDKTNYDFKYSSGKVKYETNCFDDTSKNTISDFNIKNQKEWYEKWELHNLATRTQSIYPVFENKTTNWTAGRTGLSHVWKRTIIWSKTEQPMTEYELWHENKYDRESSY